MRILKRFSKTKYGQKSIGFLFYLITKFIFFSIRWKCYDEDQKSNIFNNKNNLNFFHLNRIKEAKKNILNISNYKFNKGQDISILVFFLLKYKDKINLIFI